jgi:hypothetical protein
MRLRFVSLAVLIFVFSFTIEAQRYHRFSLQNQQLKDGLNNGLLFRGSAISYQYGIKKQKEKRLTDFHTELEIGTVFRQGLLGVNLHFKPVAYSYGVRINRTERTKVYAGAKVDWDYRFQIYPDLMMGHPLWMTSLILSPIIIVNHQISDDNSITFSISNSILGLTSRPEEIEPYFFSLRFKDVVSDLHSNIKFGSISNINDTKINLDYNLYRTKRCYSFGYEINYLNYGSNPFFKGLTHSIVFKTSKL